MILEKAFGSGPEKITYLETTSEGKLLIYLHGGFGSPDYINYLDARLTKNGLHHIYQAMGKLLDLEKTMIMNGF